MKNGFYMGYDARLLSASDIKHAADTLLDDGFYSAGYNTLILGDILRLNQDETYFLSLKNRGFRISVDATKDNVGAILNLTHADMVCSDDADLLKGLPENVVTAHYTNDNDLLQGGACSDISVLNVIAEADDFFEITRNRLDSCLPEDISKEHSLANRRAHAVGDGGYQPGNISICFDYYRNEAIFLQMCILGCPLILQGDVQKYPESLRALLKNPRIIDMARRGKGGVARYYDPWHELLSKEISPKRHFALVLNRCHGDQPTDIRPEDFGFSGRFRIEEYPAGTLAGADLESFHVHVETSDHPQTPCCKLYLVEEL